MIHIVGAGLTGSTLARLYADAGEKVTVYEKAKEVGGLCRDFEMGGTFIPCFGPHFFHTNDEEVVDYISTFECLYWHEHRVLAKVGEEYYEFPPNKTTRERLYVYRPEYECDNKYLYETFYENYTIKQWGIHPKYIDPSVIARTKVREGTDDRYFTDRFQAIPKVGYTRMIKRMLDHENITLKTSTKVDKPKEGWIWTGRIDKAVDTEPLDWRCLKFKGVTKTLPAKVVNYPGPEPYTREHQVTSDMVIREYPGWSGKKCYPMPTEANRLRAEELKEEAKRKGIILAGRMGTYSYLNMDQAIRKAMDLFKELTK